MGQSAGWVCDFLWRLGEGVSNGWLEVESWGWERGRGRGRGRGGRRRDGRHTCIDDGA
jgi:hypothetical protein